MEDNLKNIEIIEAYHEGKLSAEEEIEFEVRLLVDNELQEENELYKKILYGFHDIKTEKIRSKLRLIDEELDDQNRKESGRTKYFWFIGVAATFILGIVIFKTINAPLKFSANLIPADQGLPVLMGVESKLDFDNAMSEFKAEDYNSAINGFSSSLKVNPNNDTAMYYLGNCYLHVGNYNDAIYLYSRIIQNSKSNYFQRAQFYLALSYLGSGNFLHAKQLFIRISNSKGHPFKAEAMSLANKIR